MRSDDGRFVQGQHQMRARQPLLKLSVPCSAGVLHVGPLSLDLAPRHFLEGCSRLCANLRLMHRLGPDQQVHGHHLLAEGEARHLVMELSTLPTKLK